MTDYRDKNIVYKFFNNIFNFDYGTSKQDQIDTVKRTFGIILFGGLLAGVAGGALIAGLGPTVGGAIVIATLATVVINLLSVLVKAFMFAMFGEDTLKDSNKTAPDNTRHVNNKNAHEVKPTTASTLRPNDGVNNKKGSENPIIGSSTRPSSTTSNSSTASTSSSGSGVVSSSGEEQRIVKSSSNNNPHRI